MSDVAQELEPPVVRLPVYALAGSFAEGIVEEGGCDLKFPASVASKRAAVKPSCSRGRYHNNRFMFPNRVSSVTGLAINWTRFISAASAATGCRC